MKEKETRKICRIFDDIMTLTGSLALSVYIVYYSIFRYKGNSATDRKEYRK